MGNSCLTTDINKVTEKAHFYDFSNKALSASTTTRVLHHLWEKFSLLISKDFIDIMHYEYTKVTDWSDSKTRNDFFRLTLDYIKDSPMHDGLRLTTILKSWKNLIFYNTEKSKEYFHFALINHLENCQQKMLNLPKDSYEAQNALNYIRHIEYCRKLRADS